MGRRKQSIPRPTEDAALARCWNVYPQVEEGEVKRTIMVNGTAFYCVLAIRVIHLPTWQILLDYPTLEALEDNRVVLQATQLTSYKEDILT